MSTKIELVALRNFSGPDGSRKIGDVFEVSSKRAEFLAEGGYAKRSTRADVKAAAAADAETAQTAAAPRAAVRKST